MRLQLTSTGTRAGDAVSIHSAIGANDTLEADPRGRALSTVRPCPLLRWVPVSKPGSEDFLELRERRRVLR